MKKNEILYCLYYTLGVLKNKGQIIKYILSREKSNSTFW